MRGKNRRTDRQAENWLSVTRARSFSSFVSVPFLFSLLFFHGQQDSLQVREREWKSALRATIADVFKVQGLSSLHLATRIVTGCVTEGDTVVVLPNFEYGTVKRKY